MRLPPYAQRQPRLSFRLRVGSADSDLECGAKKQGIPALGTALVREGGNAREYWLQRIPGISDRACQLPSLARVGKDLIYIGFVFVVMREYVRISGRTVG